MDMTPDRWAYTQNYGREVFGREDEVLTQLREAAAAAGLPDIAVSADVGRLLSILTAGTHRTLAIEVGTLGGYSGIWIARGLSPDGRLITIECEPTHADFAKQQFDTAELADRVDVRQGRALDVLANLKSEIRPGTVDVAFIDAEKVEYLEYWQALRPLIAVGGLFIADNALGSGSWWIDQEGDPTRDAVDALNRTVASDTFFESTIVPIREGVLIARRVA